MRTMQQSAMSYLKSDSYCRVTALWPFILPLIVLHHWQFASASTKVTQTNQLYAFVSTVRHSFCYSKVRGLKPSSPALYMGRKITIRIVGRKQGGEEWLEDACDMYLKRLKPTGFEVCTEWYKNDAALIKVQTETMESSLTKYIPIVLLDPKGIRCTSELFTEYVYDWLEEGGSRLVIVIGGGKY
jgi:Predicted SPOUT methyltransferase